VQACVVTTLAAAADAAAAAAVMYVFNKWLTYAWRKFAAD
jgi:hypothetical protein